MQRAKHVLIFGGGFAPPTLAHEAVMEACLVLPGFDALWVLPSGDRLDKTIAFADNDRLKMLEVVKEERFAGNARLVISDFELRLPRPTATYQTAAALRAQYPDTVFTFVFGEDSYDDMHNWPHGADLKQQLDMFVVARTGVPLPRVANVRPLRLTADYHAVSSSEVRRRLLAGQSLNSLVSPPVARYLISTHQSSAGNLPQA